MPKNYCIMQIWAESGKSALPICNYSQILYQFLTFTQNLKRSRFRIQGILDFSLIGILSKIAKILAENSISIFAISTYNTDYVLIKKENYQKALDILKDSGYEIVE